MVCVEASWQSGQVWIAEAIDGEQRFSAYSASEDLGAIQPANVSNLGDTGPTVE
jgi:hypothetical protein